MMILVLIILFLVPVLYVFWYKLNENNKLKGILTWKSGRKKAREIYKSGGLESIENLIKNNELFAVAILTSEEIKDPKYKEDLVSDILIETSGVNHFLLQKVHSSSKYPTPKTFNTVRNIYTEDIKKMKYKIKELEQIFLEFKKNKITPEEFEEEMSRISLLQNNLTKNLKKE